MSKLNSDDMVQPQSGATVSPSSFSGLASLWQTTIRESELRESESGDLGEVFDYVSPIPAAILGQLIMQHLPLDGFPVESKQYWLAVAEHMGPDWIASLRRVAAFMDKVESFR